MYSNDLIKLYADKPLDYWSLSSNHNITWEISKEFPDKPWNYNYSKGVPFLVMKTVYE